MPEPDCSGPRGELDVAALRKIVEYVSDYAIFTMDGDRVVTSWSAGARAIFGYSDEEVIGRPADIVFTPEDRAAGAPEAETETARREGRADDERWHMRKDGSRFYASGVLTALEGKRIAYVKILRDLTDRKLLEDALRRSRDELESRVAERTSELARTNGRLRAEIAARDDLRRRLFKAQEEERLRLARELHDTAGQVLAGLSMTIESLARSGPLTHASTERLGGMRRAVDELSRELHAIAVRLRPTSLDDIGLVAALEQLTEGWAARSGVAVELSITNIDRRLPDEVETTIYRVVQESLTNVARHARARKVVVLLNRPDGYVVLVVEDDGVGFDPETSGLGRLGMAGMRERLSLVGGELHVESTPGAGTTIIARLPIHGSPSEGGPRMGG